MGSDLLITSCDGGEISFGLLILPVNNERSELLCICGGRSRTGLETPGGPLMEPSDRSRTLCGALSAQLWEKWLTLLTWYNQSIYNWNESASERERAKLYEFTDCHAYSQYFYINIFNIFFIFNSMLCSYTQFFLTTKNMILKKLQRTLKEMK